MSRKAKALFTSKGELHNFKSVFTPPKNYTFSHQQLTTLKIQAAEILLQIFEYLCKAESGSDSMSEDIPDFLTEGFPLGSPMLPLAYHTSWSPNQKHRCDLPGCKEKTAGIPWQIFRGCGHSYHDECLKDYSCCPICKHYLKGKIEVLSSKIRQAVYSPDANSEAQSNDSETDNLTLDIKETNENQLKTKIKHMETLIDKMVPPTPDTQQTTGNFTSVSGRIKPHCKTCGHLLNGHKRPRNAPAKCPKCPNDLCSADGKKRACSCSQHAKNVTQTELSTTQQLQYKQKQDKNVSLIILEASQGSLPESLQGLGSNACTIIAGIMGINVLKGNLSSIADPVKIVDEFVYHMKEGNALYDLVSPAFSHVNLEAIDVSKILPITVTENEIKSILDEDHLKNEL